jgi:adenylate cyclase
VLERTKRRLRLVGKVTLISAGIGIAFTLSSSGRRPAALLDGAVLGALIGAPLTDLETFGLNARGGSLLQRWPLVPVLALRTLLYALSIAVAYAVVTAVGSGNGDVGDFDRTLAYALAVSLVLSLAFMVRRMLGPQATAHFLTGRYRQPRAKERLVLFLDVEGSTALAERIGDVLFHAFLARTVLDISEAVIECGVEIHSYVGDEVIVT